MSLQNRLNVWQANHLITQEQSEQIFNFEKNSKNSLFSKTIVIAASLFIGLGICLIVASNWDQLPTFVKFFLDFGLFSGITYGAFYAFEKNQQHLKDLFLFLSFLMIAATIGLTSQTFNLSGAWHSFALFWSLLSLPYILLSSAFSLNAIWLLVFVSGISCGFFEKFLEYLFDHFTGMSGVCLGLICFSYLFYRLNNLIKQRVLLAYVASKLCMIGAYITLLGIVFGYGLPFQYNHDFTYWAVCFVVVFLTGRLMWAYIKQDIRCFKHNTFCIEAYIFGYFASLFDNLLTSGIGFILSGLSILGLFYLFKKSAKHIQKLEIFK